MNDLNGENTVSVIEVINNTKNGISVCVLVWQWRLGVTDKRVCVFSG